MSRLLDGSVSCSTPNVLYPQWLRDVLLTLAAMGYYEPVWSTRIVEEMRRNVLRGHPDIDPQHFDDTTIARDHEDPPAPEQILSRILQRKDPDRLSAHQVIEDSLRDTTSLARLGAIFEDAGCTAIDQSLRATLTSHGLQAAADDPEWPSLVSRAREAALAGHDLRRPRRGSHPDAPDRRRPL